MLGEPNIPTSSSNPEWADTLLAGLARAQVLLRQFAWIYLITIALCLGFQTYRVVSEPTVYISQAQMIVSGRIAIPEGSLYKEELSNFFGTQIRLMQSNLMQARAQERVLALNPRAQPAKVQMVANQLPNTNIFALKASGLDGPYTKAYLDAIMHEYLQFKAEMRSQTTQNTFVSITEQILTLKDEIDAMEEKKLAFQRSNNLVFIQEQGNTAGRQLAVLQDRLNKLKIRLRALDAIDFERILNEPLSSELEEILNNNDYGIDGSAYQKENNELEYLWAQKKQMSTYMRENHPEWIEVNNTLLKKEAGLQVLKRKYIKDLMDKLNATRFEIKNLQPVVAEWEARALEYSQKLGEFEQITSRLERLKKSQEQLMGSIQSIQINQNLDQEMVAILEQASLATPGAKAYASTLAMATVFGLILGSGIIFLIGAIDQRIYSVDDIALRHKEPVLGSIPKMAKEDLTTLLKQNDPRNNLAESIRNIRSALLYLNREGISPKVFLVTSSMPAEGKSTLASNLAVTLAFSASKTLLIDSDLRRGKLHERLGLPKAPGLSEGIQNHLSWQEMVQKTPIDDLDIISTGAYPSNPSELLLKPYVKELFKTLREHYDFIIVDSAPILATNDTLNLAPQTDGALFVVRAGQTRTRQAKLAMHVLNMHSLEVFGFLLNGLSSKGLSNYYYYNKYQSY
jgi:capsular exopolysaccharide synthesis family protein